MNGFCRYLMSLIMPLLPETRCFGFKRWMLRLTGTEVGRNVRICSSVSVIGSGKLKIGDNCDIAPKVYIGNGTHIITPDSSRIANIEISKDIVIGDGCWICVNSTILPGAEIGEKCVVAAGSVVTQSFTDSLCLLAGIPAVVKKRFK